MPGTSMRAALKAKQRRRETYHLVLTDPTQAQKAVEDAQANLRLARLRHEPGDDASQQALDQAETDVARANEALMEHVLPIVFEYIPPAQWEAIRTAPEHTPTHKQLAEHQADVGRAKAAGLDIPGEPEFNPDTLIPDAFAHCVVPPDGDEPMSAAEWAHELRPDGDWSAAEISEAFNTLLTAVLEPRSVTIPKG